MSDCARRATLPRWIFRRAIYTEAQSNNWPAARRSRNSKLPITRWKPHAWQRLERSRSAEAERVGDPGYHLIAEGRRALERTIGFRPPPRLRISRFNIRLGIGGYVGAILLVTAVLLALALWALSPSPALPSAGSRCLL